jgi:hypothetical protein
VRSAVRNIERLPNERELHHWADYAELNCLVSSDGLYSPSQLAVQIRRGRDTGQAATASTQGDAFVDERTLDALLGVADSADPALDILDSAWDADLDIRTTDSEPLEGADLRDSFSRRADDIWRHLKYRSSAFAENWPFLLEPITQTLQLVDELTEGQKLYSFFLLCSSLRYVDASNMAKLTRAFELVAHRALSAAFPGWQVHVFGTAAEAGSMFSQSQLWERLIALAAALRCRLLVDREEVSDKNVGDGGLDLVAWLPLPEKSKGLPMAFAQCACGASNWKQKQGEANEDHWGEIIKLSASLQNWTFIPFCYHNPQGDWETRFQVQKGILADRLRLFELLNSRLAELSEIVSGTGLSPEGRVASRES